MIGYSLHSEIHLAKETINISGRTTQKTYSISFTKISPFMLVTKFEAHMKGVSTLRQQNAAFPEVTAKGKKK